MISKNHRFEISFSNMKPVIEKIGSGGGGGPRFILPCTDCAPVNRFPWKFLCRQDLVWLDLVWFFGVSKSTSANYEKYESLKKSKFQGFIKSTFFPVFGSKNRLRQKISDRPKNRVFFDKFPGEWAAQIANRLTGAQSVQGNIPHPPPPEPSLSITGFILSFQIW